MPTIESPRPPAVSRLTVTEPFCCLWDVSVSAGRVAAEVGRTPLADKQSHILISWHKTSSHSISNSKNQYEESSTSPPSDFHKTHRPCKPGYFLAADNCLQILFSNSSLLYINTKYHLAAGLCIWWQWPAEEGEWRKRGERRQEEGEEGKGSCTFQKSAPMVPIYENSPKLLTWECVGAIITTADSRTKAADEPLERLSVMTSERRHTVPPY